MKHAPFVIFALPRSRTAWLAHWLSYVRDGKRVRNIGHDAFSRCRTIDECLGLFEGANALDGTVETGAAFAYPLVKKRLPEARLLVIQRDPAACLASLVAKGIVPNPADWERRVRDLWVISGAGERKIEFEDLNIESCARWLWEYTLGLPWDRDWWMHWLPVNVQVAMHERMDELENSAEAIEALKNEIREAQS